MPGSAILTLVGCGFFLSSLDMVPQSLLPTFWACLWGHDGFELDEVASGL